MNVFDTFEVCRYCHEALNGSKHLSIMTDRGQTEFYTSCFELSTIRISKIIDGAALQSLLFNIGNYSMSKGHFQILTSINERFDSLPIHTSQKGDFSLHE